mmetsp:Transcript_58530/g.114981  ORF Transcript_58530/g.114981 Transcript_58530/m.114981 type:complete len:231 (+) Transcript_58530:3-695(+)
MTRGGLSAATHPSPLFSSCKRLRAASCLRDAFCSPLIPSSSACSSGDSKRPRYPSTVSSRSGAGSPTHTRRAVPSDHLSKTSRRRTFLSLANSFCSWYLRRRLNASMLAQSRLSWDTRARCPSSSPTKASSKAARFSKPLRTLARFASAWARCTSHPLGSHTSPEKDGDDDDGPALLLKYSSAPSQQSQTPSETREVGMNTEFTPAFAHQKSTGLALGAAAAAAAAATPG